MGGLPEPTHDEHDCEGEGVSVSATSSQSPISKSKITTLSAESSATDAISVTFQNLRGCWPTYVSTFCDVDLPPLDSDEGWQPFIDKVGDVIKADDRMDFLCQTLPHNEY